MRRRSAHRPLLALCCCWLTAVHAQEAEQLQAPELELEFLEYLGAWAEADDEWLAIEEWQKDEATAPEDVQGSEAEKDDDDESE